MHEGENTYMMIFFEDLDCTECRKHATVIGRLAKHTSGSP